VIKGTASGTDAAGGHFWNHGGNIGAIKGNFTQREL
jgi:hypothetical protein